MKFKVWRKGNGDDFESATVFDQNFLNDYIEYVAEVYAEHYHDNCDGRECSWPIEFMVATEDGRVLGCVEVVRGVRPIADSDESVNGGSK